MRFALLFLLIGCGRDAPEPAPTPGRVTLHRLNIAEYDNTVRDLFGTALRPAAAVFPSDDFGYGFDNIAAVLSVSPLHLEMYEVAADLLLDELFGWAVVEPSTTVLEAETLDATVGAVHQGTAWILWDEGALSGSVEIGQGGTYTVDVRAWAQHGGDEDPVLAVTLDDLEVGRFDVSATEVASHVLELPLDPGFHDIAVQYLNNWEEPPDGDRNLIVDQIALTGPLGVAAPPPAGRDQVLVCTPSTAEEEPGCARDIVRRFGRRAFRRPLTDDEFDRKMALYGVARNAGAGWDEAVATALRGLLLSPQFLYRVERDVDPSSPIPHRITDHELAARLSYFLWSSTPDETLLDLADAGALSDPEVLAAQARRMLADPRADALVDNFGGQLFYIRAVDVVSPIPELFPDWDGGLQASMKDEMRRFLKEVLLEDTSLLAIFTADWTYADARLAEHYGLDIPSELGFQRVSLSGVPRRGLLTMGGLLTATSYPTRTSPVRRGKYVLEKLMCAQPPPPPPVEDDDVPEIPDADTLSQRDIMALHRENPACAACHTYMDPIGVSMENYDAIGAYRTEDEKGLPVDATGVLPNGIAFDEIIGLSASLAASDMVSGCLVQQAFTYALGRAPTVEDLGTLDGIEADFIASDFRFRELAVAIVGSDAFRYRAGSPEEL